MNNDEKIIKDELCDSFDFNNDDISIGSVINPYIWEEKTQEDLKEMMITYRTGTVEQRKVITTFFIEKLTPYIYDCIKKQFINSPSNYEQNKDDLFQEACFAILDNLENFDPYKGRPTTFFNSLIYRYCSQYDLGYIHRNTSRHYANNIRKISIAKEEIAATDGKVDTLVLKNKTGLSYRQIEQAEIENLLRQNVALDDSLNLKASSFQMPEKASILKYENSTLIEAFLKLSLLERKILTLTLGLTDGIPKRVQAVSSELGITPQRVKELSTRALRTLKRSSEMQTAFKELCTDHIEESILDQETFDFITTDAEIDEMLEEIIEMNIDF